MLQQLDPIARCARVAPSRSSAGGVTMMALRQAASTGDPHPHADASSSLQQGQVALNLDIAGVKPESCGDGRSE